MTQQPFQFSTSVLDRGAFWKEATTAAAAAKKKQALIHFVDQHFVVAKNGTCDDWSCVII